MTFEVKKIAPMTANSPDVEGFPVVYGYSSADTVTGAGYFNDYHGVLNKGDEIWSSNAGVVTKYKVDSVDAGVVVISLVTPAAP